MVLVGPRPESLVCPITAGLAYAAASIWLLLHLPLVQPISSHGDRLGLANGMSFFRLGLAPVLACGWTWAAPGTSAGFITAGLVAGLALTDLLDGLAARLQKRITRLGVGLDPFADLIFFGCLATGLHGTGQLSDLAFALVLFRYPGAFLGGMVAFLARTPMPKGSSLVGKAASFSTACLLTCLAGQHLIAPGLLPIEWVAGIGYAVVGFTGFNILHMMGRVFRA